MKNLYKNIYLFLMASFIGQVYAVDSLHYTGRLVQTNGAPLTTNRSLAFELLKGPSATPTVLCRLDKTNIPLQNGVFNVEVRFEPDALNIDPCAVGRTYDDVVREAVEDGVDLFIRVTDATSTPIVYPKQLITVPPVALYARKTGPESTVHTSLKGIAANCTAGKYIVTNGTDGFTCADIGSGSGTVGTTNIADGSITTNKLADGSVTEIKIAADAVTSAKIDDGTIVTADLADGSVTSAKIFDGTIATADVADSAITSAKIADATIATGDLADDAVTGAKIADNSIATNHVINGTLVVADLSSTGCTAGKYVMISGSGTFSCADLTGSVGTTDMADGSVTSAKILDGTIATIDMADSSVNSAKIANSSILIADISTSGTCTAGKFLTISATGNFQCADLTGSVGTTDLADGSVTSAKILDGTIATIDMADSSITSAKILDGTIAAADIAAGAVGTSEIADLSVSTADIGNQQITQTKLSGIVANCTAGQLITAAASGAFVCANAPTSLTPTGAAGGDLTGTYPNPTIAAGVVTATELATSAVTGAKILDGTITAADIAASAVTTSEIADGTIGTADLAAGAVTSAKIDTTTVQTRVSGTCAVGSAMRVISATGTVTCESVGAAFTGAGTAGRIPRWTAADALGNSSITDTGTAATATGEFYANSWLRSNTSGAGWYHQVHGGGWYMSDATWIRAYGSKSVWTPAEMQADTAMRSAAYYYTSDKRLKKNVRTYPDALDKMLELRGVYFDWKKDDKKDVGFIAQEVEKVEPRLVDTNKEGTKSVKYGNIVAIVIEAVKELREKLMSEDKEIKREIASVKKENEELKERLKEQEARLNRQEEMLKKLVESDKK